jgi:tRNA nucleotidyltransferase (CCA-adding enzyme)
MPDPAMTYVKKDDSSRSRRGGAARLRFALDQGRAAHGARSILPCTGWAERGDGMACDIEAAGAGATSAQNGDWELFPHGADVGVRGFGASREAAFEQAARALTAALTDPKWVRPRQAVKIACEAPDQELLLVDWLNALIYEMATRKMLFGRFAVRIENGRLRAEAWGEPVDVARHAPAAEAKGATYTELSVAQQEDGRWVAQCIVDV